MNKNKFTLIELLVVIAIIAILASILLPALSKAREQGRRIACASTENQLGKAFSFYVSDYDGYLPAYRDYGSPEKSWHKGTPERGFLAEYLGLNDIYASIGFIGINGGEMRRSKFACPSHEAPPSGVTHYSYGYSSSIYNRSSRKLSRFSTPSETAMLSEMTTTPLLSYTTTTGSNIMGFRHFSGANVLFCDSHVSWKKITEIPDQTYNPSANKDKFWDPEK